VFFPTKGVLQRLTAEVSLPVLDLQYYKVDYKQTWYKEIYNGYIFMLNGEIGYADTYDNENFPFFKNYYMGGVNSVRGYQNATLGPRGVDSNTGREFAIGGTKRLLGNAEFFFPVPGMKDSGQFRMSAFVDAGNVWGPNELGVSDSYSLGDLRYSAGIGASWISPFGPLKVVFAKALNSEPGDDTQTIQFQMGQQF
jgi:outer membrane protein insertion porin family